MVCTYGDAKKGEIGMRVLIILWTLVVVVIPASSQDMLQLKN
ncbi:uncharacterized protein METZ01_LOCUS416798, partial [marine metagenome]